MGSDGVLHSEPRSEASEGLFQESEARNVGDVLQYVPDAVLMVDTEGHIFSWNAAAERLFGYTAAEAVGRHISCLVPKDLVAEQAALLKKIVSGRSLHDHQTRRQTKTGQAVEVSLTVGPLRDRHGQLSGLCAILRDVTEQRLQEETLRKSEQRYRALLNALPDLVFRLQPDGIILDFNAASEGGPSPYVPPDEFLGRKMSDVLPSQAAQLLDDATHRCLQTRSTQVVEYELPEHPGEGALTKIFEARVVRCGQDEVVAYVRDVTKRRQADELRSEFVERLTLAQDGERRRISRELHDQAGQVFSSAIFKLQAIQDAAPNGPACAQLAEVCRDVEAGVEELRRLARGLHPSLLEDLGLDAALQRLVSEFSQATGIAVDVQATGLEGTSELASNVSIALYRVIQEALTNTAKHSGASRASVTLRRTPSNVHVLVEDNGRGFRQGPHRTGEPEATGTPGLGLIGIRERIALLNGKTKIESLPDEGVTVCADVPIDPADSRAQT